MVCRLDLGCDPRYLIPKLVASFHTAGLHGMRDGARWHSGGGRGIGRGPGCLLLHVADLRVGTHVICSMHDRLTEHIVWLWR